MKRFLVLVCAGLLALLAQSPQAKADGSLQDIAVNINGTIYDYNNTGQPDLTTLSGMNATAFSTYTSGDKAGTGLGTLTFTFNPGAPGTYFVNFYIDESAGTPFFNEYGVVNGSKPAGTSWEVAQVNPSVGGIQFWNGASGSFPNALDNTNHAPIGNTNYLNNCTVSPCNADVATALGFNFTLTSGQEAVITIDQSTTNPGGFNLEQVHPADPNNPTSDLFLSGSVSIKPSGPPPVPEPGTLTLLGVGAATILGSFKRRREVAS